MISILKRFSLPLIITLIFLGLTLRVPAIGHRSLDVTLDYLKEMIIIMPPVFILMGLLEVWVPKNKIQSWLGRGSGLKGAVISFALGTLPTGPLYAAFPMAGSLLRKGARVSNMVIFLGSWAALKIPQLMIEIKFIGLAFTSLRFVLTLSALVLMGFLMEFLLRLKPYKYLIDQNDPDQ